METGGSATGGFCAGCGQKLVGSYLNAMGQKWHKACFVWYVFPLHRYDNIYNLIWYLHLHLLWI